MKKTVSIILALSIALTLTFAVFANPDSTTVISDTNVMVYGPLTAYAPLGDGAWGSSKNAMNTWVHGSWPTIEGANWISTSYYIGDADDGGPIAVSTWRWFTKTIDLCPGAYNINGTIKATSDNAEVIYVNGVYVGSDGEVQDPWEDNYEWQTVLDYPFTTAPSNTLTLDFIVRNYPGSSSPTGNPTGLIFEATVDYSCPIIVDIDIKPGSDPSCFNSNEHGVIPVAIFGSADFDVTQIDVGTVALDGAEVAVKGKADKALAAYEYVNGDGFMDLSVKIVDMGGYTPGDTYATLTGNLLPEFGSTPFLGTGNICITQ